MMVAMFKVISMKRQRLSEEQIVPGSGACHDTVSLGVDHRDGGVVPL